LLYKTVEPGAPPNAGFFVSSLISRQPMAKKFQDRDRLRKRKLKKENALPFTKINYYIIAVGIGLVVLGFIVMGEGSVEGTLPLVVAPILLVIGYCVILPIGILYKRKELEPETPSVPREPQAPTS
jgi:hypothetical protein